MSITNLNTVSTPTTTTGVPTASAGTTTSSTAVSTTGTVGAPTSSSSTVTVTALMNKFEQGNMTVKDLVAELKNKGITSQVKTDDKFTSVTFKYSNKNYTIRSSNVNNESGTDSNKTTSYSDTTLRTTYKFSTEVINKYFDVCESYEDSAGKTTVTKYTIKENCGYSSPSALRTALYNEVKDQLVLSTFLADKYDKNSTNSYLLTKVNSGKTNLSTTNYTTYADEIKKAAGDDVVKLKQDALNKVIKDFSCGNLVVQQLDTVLKSIGVENKTRTLTDGKYVVKFEFLGKNYQITCNQAAATKGGDTVHNKSYVFDSKFLEQINDYLFDELVDEYLYKIDDNNYRLKDELSLSDFLKDAGFVTELDVEFLKLKGVDITEFTGYEEMKDADGNVIAYGSLDYIIETNSDKFAKYNLISSNDVQSFSAPGVAEYLYSQISENFYELNEGITQELVNYAKEHDSRTIYSLLMHDLEVNHKSVYSYINTLSSNTIDYEALEADIVSAITDYKLHGNKAIVENLYNSVLGDSWHTKNLTEIKTLFYKTKDTNNVDWIVNNIKDLLIESYQDKYSKDLDPSKLTNLFSEVNSMYEKASGINSYEAEDVRAIMSTVLEGAVSISLNSNHYDSILSALEEAITDEDLLNSCKDEFAYYIHNSINNNPSKLEMFSDVTRTMLETPLAGHAQDILALYNNGEVSKYEAEFALRYINNNVPITPQARVFIENIIDNLGDKEACNKILDTTAFYTLSSASGYFTFEDIIEVYETEFSEFAEGGKLRKEFEDFVANMQNAMVESTSAAIDSTIKDIKNCVMNALGSIKDMQPSESDSIIDILNSLRISYNLDQYLSNMECPSLEEIFGKNDIGNSFGSFEEVMNYIMEQIEKEVKNSSLKEFDPSKTLKDEMRLTLNNALESFVQTNISMPVEMISVTPEEIQAYVEAMELDNEGITELFYNNLQASGMSLVELIDAIKLQAVNQCPEMTKTTLIQNVMLNLSISGVKESNDMDLMAERIEGVVAQFEDLVLSNGGKLSLKAVYDAYQKDGITDQDALSEIIIAFGYYLEKKLEITDNDLVMSKLNEFLGGNPNSLFEKIADGKISLSSIIQDNMATDLSDYVTPAPARSRQLGSNGKTSISGCPVGNGRDFEIRVSRDGIGGYYRINEEWFEPGGLGDYFCDYTNTGKPEGFMMSVGSLLCPVVGVWDKINECGHLYVESRRAGKYERLMKEAPTARLREKYRVLYEEAKVGRKNSLISLGLGVFGDGVKAGHSKFINLDDIVEVKNKKYFDACIDGHSTIAGWGNDIICNGTQEKIRRTANQEVRDKMKDIMIDREDYCRAHRKDSFKEGDVSEYAYRSDEELALLGISRTYIKDDKGNIIGIHWKDEVTGKEWDTPDEDIVALCSPYRDYTVAGGGNVKPADRISYFDLTNGMFTTWLPQVTVWGSYTEVKHGSVNMLVEYERLAKLGVKQQTIASLRDMYASTQKEFYNLELAIRKSVLNSDEFADYNARYAGAWFEHYKKDHPEIFEQMEKSKQKQLDAYKDMLDFVGFVQSYGGTCYVERKTGISATNGSVITGYAIEIAWPGGCFPTEDSVVKQYVDKAKAFYGGMSEQFLDFFWAEQEGKDMYDTMMKHTPAWAQENFTPEEADEMYQRGVQLEAEAEQRRLEQEEAMREYEERMAKDNNYSNGTISSEEKEQQERENPYAYLAGVDMRFMQNYDTSPRTIWTNEGLVYVDTGEPVEKEEYTGSIFNRE